jgi:endonuclease YncB( thermonuclease family)
MGIGMARAQTFDGQAIAKDGDDLIIAGTDIRLFGIDAFEFGQMCEADGAAYACGQLAKQDLAKKVLGREVHCEQRDYDSAHKRPVAVCSVDGEDVNAWMVSEGWAIAYRKFSMDYVDEENDAHAKRKGAWRGLAEHDMVVFPGRRLRDWESYWHGAVEYRNQEDFDHLFAALRKAGLPD